MTTPAGIPATGAPITTPEPRTPDAALLPESAPEENTSAAIEQLSASILQRVRSVIRSEMGSGDLV